MTILGATDIERVEDIPTEQATWGVYPQEVLDKVILPKKMNHDVQGDPMCVARVKWARINCTHASYRCELAGKIAYITEKGEMAFAVRCFRCEDDDEPCLVARGRDVCANCVGKKEGCNCGVRRE